MQLDLYSSLPIAIALAMDAFSVAIVTGFVLKRVNFNQASKMALSFGLFHLIMPMIGWYIGSSIVELIADYDHWLAFLLLAFVGSRMIFGAIKEGKIESSEIFNGWNLLLFSIAVSIDALAVGLAFYLENISIFLPVVFIVAMTIIFTLVGLVVGSRTGRFFGKSVAIMGGLLLIAIGLRIVFSHML